MRRVCDWFVCKFRHSIDDFLLSRWVKIWKDIIIVGRENRVCRCIIHCVVQVMCVIRSMLLVIIRVLRDVHRQGDDVDVKKATQRVFKNTKTRRQGAVQATGMRSSV